MWKRLRRWLDRDEQAPEAEEEPPPAEEQADPAEEEEEAPEPMPELDLEALAREGWDALLEPIPDEDLGLLLAAATRQARAQPTPGAVRALATLRSALLARGGDAVGLVLPHLLEATAEVAAQADVHPVRLEALRALRQLRDHRHQVERAHEATLALAQALAEAGEVDQAERTWLDAMERARGMARGKDRSPQARDRLARSLHALGDHLGPARSEEALIYLEGAVDTARDGQVQARARVSLAALLLELGRREEARPHLQQALGLLEGDDPALARARALLDTLALGVRSQARPE